VRENKESVEEISFNKIDYDVKRWGRGNNVIYDGDGVRSGKDVDDIEKARSNNEVR
jgi:hypothetical protein